MEKTYKILKLVILVLALVVLLLGAARLYNALSAQVPDRLAGGAQTEQRQMAPDFTVYDLEGNAHKLSDFQGMPVVLNFWASWCGPCKSEMPDFEEKYQVYGDQVQFLIVNLTDGSQETVATASSYVASQGYSFPVYFDTDMDAAYRYGVSAIPVTYFIDSEGALVTYRKGMISAEVLQKGIDLLLG